MVRVASLAPTSEPCGWLSGQMFFYSTKNPHELFNCMADVLQNATSAISWEEARQRGAPLNCEAAFIALVQNLQLIPILEHPNEPEEPFLQGTSDLDKNLVWQFRVPNIHLSEGWLPFVNRNEPTRTFRYMGHHLVPISNCIPARHAILKRIIVRSPKFANSHIHLGRWQRDNLMITQYQWRDGTAILQSSTAQLKILQVLDHSRQHSALSKWERQLACTIPTKIWQDTWMPFRSAAEDTFLW